MSLEQRLIDTLRRADDFEPSPDLFARVERSLDEDLRHRRRVRWAAASLTVGVVTAAIFLRAVISVDPSGLLVAPEWALELLLVLTQVVVGLTLGPILRRFGKPFIADVFRFGPETGYRFVALLDIAFYLFLLGTVLVRPNLQAWDQMVMLGEEAWQWTARLAMFLLVMGVAHIFNLAFMPLIGLFFSSTMRRVRRRQAGPAAPPLSARAEQAERVVRLIIWTAAGLALVVVVIGVGSFTLLGFFGR
ncbi:MAG: hypothetical protein M3P87_04800 [Actinomycetota bacterium]|nr:hypothetical protein [Actinomycetota bacterium]